MPERFNSPTYGPEFTRLMRAAFDEAWLQFADHERDAHLLASAIIDAVDAGVRDHRELVRRAVSTLSKTAPVRPKPANDEAAMGDTPDNAEPYDGAPM
jgi:hypothetical protein